MNTDKGLVDLHGHWYEGSAFGIDPAICLNHGVTTVVDAGTTGFVNFEELRRTRTENAPLRVLAFLNIAAIGIPTTLAGELEDPAGAGDGPHRPGGGDARDPAPAAPGGTS